MGRRIESWTDGDLGFSSGGGWERRVRISILRGGVFRHPCPPSAKSPFLGFSFLTCTESSFSGPL